MRRAVSNTTHKKKNNNNIEHMYGKHAHTNRIMSCSTYTHWGICRHNGTRLFPHNYKFKCSNETVYISANFQKILANTTLTPMNNYQQRERETIAVTLSVSVGHFIVRQSIEMHRLCIRGKPIDRTATETRLSIRRSSSYAKHTQYEKTWNFQIFRIRELLELNPYVCHSCVDSVTTATI